MSELGTFHLEIVNETGVRNGACMCAYCPGSDYPEFPHACGCWLQNNHKKVVIVENRSTDPVTP